MSQNIYDRQDFFEAYSKFIDRSNEPVDDDLLWKRLRTLLPADIHGYDILDVGCGSGWFSRWAVTNGASSVLGLDISQNMIAKGRKASEARPGDAGKLEYRISDLDILPITLSDKAPYDLIFSSVAFHYLKNLEPLVKQLVDAMKPGTLLVVNVEHPTYTAPKTPRVVEDKETGEKSWNLSAYHEEGERVVDWLAPGLRKYHRTMTGYMDIFLGNGLSLVKFLEWLPTEEELASGDIDDVEQYRPLFLMMSFRK